jgi:hypothetical protein
VSRISHATQFAFPTPGVDLTNNTPANQLTISTPLNYTDKLVSDRSIETSVPTRNLEIRITNPRQDNTDQRFICVARRFNLPHR